VLQKTVRVLLLGAGLSGCALLSGCTMTYVQRAETAYDEGRYLEVAEQLAKREADMPNTTSGQRARYGVYRGLSLLRLGDYDGAERWLSYARGLEQQLNDEQRAKLDAGVAELSELRGLDGVARANR
jgi:hypothetical protein